MRKTAAPGVLVSAVALACLLAAPAPAQPNPFDQQIAPIEVGATMPPTSFVDQRGARFAFQDLRGQTTVVGFIYTRCTDTCPVITQKFGVLDRMLGSGPYQLVEVSIDPSHDTLPVVRAYAQKFGATSSRWRILTGEPHAVESFVRSSGISVIDNGKEDLIHNARLLIVDPHGRLADVVELVAWDPATVVAQVRHVAGESSNIFGRANFALTSTIAQFCGGSYQAASGIVDVLASVLLVGAGIFILGWLRRRMLSQGS